MSGERETGVGILASAENDHIAGWHRLYAEPLTLRFSASYRHSHPPNLTPHSSCWRRFRSANSASSKLGAPTSNIDKFITCAALSSQMSPVVAPATALPISRTSLMAAESAANAPGNHLVPHPPPGARQAKWSADTYSLKLSTFDFLRHVIPQQACRCHAASAASIHGKAPYSLDASHTQIRMREHG